VDAETALAYELANFVDPNLAAVVHFKGTSRYEAAIHHGKYGCMKKRAVLIVEGAVNEDVSPSRQLEAYLFASASSRSCSRTAFLKAVRLNDVGRLGGR
jgi:hypothetical protein